MHPTLFRLLAIALAAITPLSAQVTINELSAAPNERALRYDATGQPRLGSGPAWFDSAYDASSWLTGAGPLGFNAGNTGLGTNLKTTLDGVPAMVFTGDGARTFYKDYGIMAINGGVYDGSGVWSEPNAITDYSFGIMHGRAFERPLFLEWLRNDGQPGFSEDAGIRIASSPFSRPRLRLTQTAASPWPANATEKPSFNLFFREDYGNAELSYPFLGQDYPVNTFDELRPRAGKNDISNPFIKDELVRRMFRDMGRLSVQGNINTLYINGVYKGFFNTVEREWGGTVAPGAGIYTAPIVLPGQFVARAIRSHGDPTGGGTCHESGARSELDDVIHVGVDRPGLVAARRIGGALGVSCIYPHSATNIVRNATDDAYRQNMGV